MGSLLLRQKERRRLEVLSRVRDEGMSVAEAARLLGVSERQAWRLKRRHAKGGDAGLAHGLRGRASNRKTADAARAAILKLYRAKYAGFGPTLACEYLAAEDGRVVSADALGRWLAAEGCSSRGANAASTGCVGRGVAASANWCRWTARGTTGWRAAARGVV